MTTYSAECLDCDERPVYATNDADIRAGWVAGHHKQTGHARIDVWEVSPRRRVEFAVHCHDGWTSEDADDDADQGTLKRRALCRCGWRSEWCRSDHIGNRALGVHIAEATATI